MRRLVLAVLVSLLPAACTGADPGLVVASDASGAAPIVIDPAISATTVIQQRTSPVNDRNADDRFGAAAFITGNRVIIGAPYDDLKDSQNNARTDNGTAYIFVRAIDGSWTQERKLVPFVGHDNDHLGVSVGLSVGAPSAALVGAPDAGNRYGAVVLFLSNQNGEGSWGETKRLVAQLDADTTDGSANARFGVALHMTFEWLVVGSEAGRAYVYFRDEPTLDNWGFVKRLVGAGADGFGVSVAIADDLVVVGAPLDDTQGPDAGAAYLFQRDLGGARAFGQVVKLLPDAGASGHHFGAAVGVSGRTVVVGAPLDPQRGSAAGAVHVFDRDQGGAGQWGRVDKLVASDGAANHRLGATLALAGTTLTVGAPGANTVYVFAKDYVTAGSWAQASAVTAGDWLAGDQFGAAVALANDTLLVGESARAARSGADPAPLNAGAAYARDLVFLGRSCRDSSDCKSTHCVDGVCCESACAGACDHCVGLLTGLDDGRCGPAYDDTPCDDGDACTQTASCLDGGCLGADPIVCTALDQCHDPGVCDPATGSCSTPDKTDNAPCDDNNPCTQTDLCIAGFCLGTRPRLCEASDDCHAVGVCEATTGLCTNPLRVDGTFCNDANLCTSNDSCQGGVCVGAATRVCLPLDACHDPGVCNPASGQCSNPVKADGASCDDGLFCTINDACTGGSCRGAFRTCVSGVSCKSGACDEELKECSGAPFPDASSCDDGDPCTRADSCAAGVCVGTTYVCDDGDPCTADHCTGDGSCSQSFAPVVCDDGELCTHSDRCEVGGGCLGVGYSCDDGNPCTDDVCNGDGTCGRVPNHASCDDGNACTTVDVCEQGVCRGTTPVTCTAADGCHEIGLCDPTSGSCSTPAKLDGTLCDDGAFCTVNDVCAAGVCGGVARVCGAGISCRDGSCDEAGDRCTGANTVLDGTPCTDGDYCTAGDVCAAGVCAGVAYDCDDGNGCTTDQCNGTGGCTRSNNRAPCSDGNPCSVADVCFGGQCRGSDYSCSDGNPCTADLCDGNGSCSHSPNTASCDDGDLCTGGDHCVDGACVSGTIDACVDSGPGADGGPLPGDTGRPDDGDPVTPPHKEGCRCDGAGGSAWGLAALVVFARRRRSAVAASSRRRRSLLQWLGLAVVALGVGCKAAQVSPAPAGDATTSGDVSAADPGSGDLGPADGRSGGDGGDAVGPGDPGGAGDPGAAGDPGTAGDPQPTWPRLGVYVVSVDGTGLRLLVSGGTREISHVRRKPGSNWLTGTRYGLDRDGNGLAMEGEVGYGANYEGTEVIVFSLDAPATIAVPAGNPASGIAANSSWTADGKLLYLHAPGGALTAHLDRISFSTVPVVSGVAEVPVPAPLVIPVDPHQYGPSDATGTVVFSATINLGGATPAQWMRPLWRMPAVGEATWSGAVQIVGCPLCEAQGGCCHWSDIANVLGTNDARINNAGTRVVWMQQHPDVWASLGEPPVPYFPYRQRLADLSGANLVDPTPAAIDPLTTHTYGEWRHDDQEIVYWTIDVEGAVVKQRLYRMAADGSSRRVIPLPPELCPQHPSYLSDTEIVFNGQLCFGVECSCDMASE